MCLQCGGKKGSSPETTTRCPRGKGEGDTGIDALNGKGKGKDKGGHKGCYKGYGKDKGKGKGKQKGYGKDPRSMSSMDGGKFATINEEDIDWGHDEQWGGSSQDAWNVSSVARSQESDAPWNAVPDSSWTQSAEGSAWYTKGCGSMGERRGKSRPLIRSMNPMNMSTPPGLGMYSVGVKRSTTETKNRFETLEVSEGDAHAEDAGQSEVERHGCLCCKFKANRTPDITMLVKSEVVKSRVEAKVNRKQRLKEAKEQKARTNREEDQLLEQEAVINEAQLQYWKDECVLSPSTSIREEEKIEEYAVKREIAGMEKTPGAPGPSTKYSTYATDNYPVDDSLSSSQHKKADIVDSQNGAIESAKIATQLWLPEPGNARNIHPKGVAEVLRHEAQGRAGGIPAQEGNPKISGTPAGEMPAQKGNPSNHSSNDADTSPENCPSTSTEDTEESSTSTIYILEPKWNFAQAETDDDGAEDEVKKSAAEADDDGTQAEGENDDKAEIAETQVEMGKRGDARETENADEADIAETQAEMGKRGDTREAENADEELRTEGEELKTEDEELRTEGQVDGSNEDACHK